MVYRMFYGSLDRDENRAMTDMNAREIALMVPLAVLMLYLGLAPRAFLEMSEPATNFVLETVEQKRLAAIEAAEATQLMVENVDADVIEQDVVNETGE